MESGITHAVKAVWSSLTGAGTTSRRRRPAQQGSPTQQRPQTQTEIARAIAEERVAEIRGWIAHQAERRQARRPATRRRNRAEAVARPNRRRSERQRTPQHDHTQWSPLEIWMDLTWAKHWRQQGANRRETTWQEPWAKRPQRLYKYLTKPQSTALFLLRTEVIGLNR